MVGLVLVSHSRTLVEGLSHFVQQVAGEIPIACAGGTADGRLGTDATAVAAAIDRVWSPDGVLVLVDLGSSVLSTEMALELMPPERSQGVQLSGAPLVEGAVVAAMEIKLGRPLGQVQAAAEAAMLIPKV